MRIQALTEVIALAEKLNPEEKLQLIEHIARELQRTPPSPPLLVVERGEWVGQGNLGRDRC